MAKYHCDICGKDIEGWIHYKVHMAEHQRGLRPEQEQEVTASGVDDRGKAWGSEGEAAAAPLDQIEAKMNQASHSVHVADALILASTTLAASIPIVSNADAIDEVWRFPLTSAMNRVIEEFHSTKWNVVTKAKYTRWLLAKYQPLQPGIGDLTALWAKRRISTEAYDKAMREQGLSGTWSTPLREAALTMPDLDTLFTMWRRGIISAETFWAWCERNGMHYGVKNELMALKDLIPGAGDLIRMVVREAFDPKMVVPAPDVFAAYMAKQGYAKEWSDRYWTAHFEPIELRQAYENLWRGNWDEDSFRYALYIKDIHPNWWDDILNVAFQPPGMRELGYGFDVGVYKREDIVKYRRWGGLSPQDAEKAADSLIAYRTEAEREAVRREHLHLFAIGKETMPQFEAALNRLGTAAPAIPLWKERAELEKVRREKEPAMFEQRAVSSSEALAAFSMGIRDEAWTRQRLADLYWAPERIDLAMERTMWQDSAGDEIRKHRSVLEAKLKEGFLKKSDFETELMTLGFTPAVIAALGEWADEAAEWDDVSEQASAWWTLAKAGKISSEEYAQKVRKLGMVEERITSKQQLLAKLAQIRMAEAAAKAAA